MGKYIIDRFEGDFAVVEDYDTGTIKNLKRENFPKEAKDGDIINISDNNIITIDTEETKKRKEKMENLRKMLKKNKEN